MPAVTIFVPAPLRPHAEGLSELAASAVTVQEALESLEQTHPVLYRHVCDETGAVRRHLNVFVNDDNVRDLAGVATKLRQGDAVIILPAVSGG